MRINFHSKPHFVGINNFSLQVFYGKKWAVKKKCLKYLPFDYTQRMVQTRGQKLQAKSQKKRKKSIRIAFIKLQLQAYIRNFCNTYLFACLLLENELE